MSSPVGDPEQNTARHVSTRDPRLDAVRGLLLVAMTADHLPGPVRGWIYEFFGYVSAAEGFVFLSGFVAGITYGRTSYEKGSGALWHRVFKRGRLIYMYHMFTFVVLLIALRLFAGNEAYWITWKPLLQGNLAMSIIRGCTLLYQPRFLDILPMYCVFIFITPIVIECAKRRKGPYALIICGVVWGTAQFGIFQKLASIELFGLPISLGGFDIFAWQFLFVVGLYLGFVRNQRGKQRAASWGIVGLYALAVSTIFFALKHGFFSLQLFASDIQTLTNTHLLAPLRVLNFFALAVLSSVILRTLQPNPIIRALAYLGRHSLQVFSYHIFLVHFVDLVAVPNIGKARQIAIVLICITSLYLPAWFMEGLKTGRRTSNT